MVLMQLCPCADVMVVGLLVALALCGWVAVAFRNNRFDHGARYGQTNEGTV
jgi:hypothetical protein